MSATIFYYELNKFLSEEQQLELINLWASEIPNEKKNKIQKLRLKKDQLLSLAGLKLLQLGISKITGSALPLRQLQFPYQRKPFIKGALDFNISHSGNIVCCVISEDTNVGIDIELHRNVSLITMNKFLTKHTGNTQKTDNQRFFELWTKYESIIKAANHGSIFNIGDIILEEDKGIYQEKNWYCYPIKTETNQSNSTYTCHIACSEKTDTINVQKIIEL